MTALPGKSTKLGGLSHFECDGLAVSLERVTASHICERMEVDRRRMGRGMGLLRTEPFAGNSFRLANAVPGAGGQCAALRGGRGDVLVPELGRAAPECLRRIRGRSGRAGAPRRSTRLMAVSKPAAARPSTAPCARRPPGGNAPAHTPRVCPQNASPPAWTDHRRPPPRQNVPVGPIAQPHRDNRETTGP